MCLNAAQAAFAMRQELELSGRWEIEVLYGVYNLYNHQVRMPNNPLAPLVVLARQHAASAMDMATVL